MHYVSSSKTGVHLQSIVKSCRMSSMQTSSVHLDGLDQSVVHHVVADHVVTTPADVGVDVVLKQILLTVIYTASCVA